MVNNKNRIEMDQKTTIEELKEQVKRFCEDRDWDQFHNGKELAIALSIEASELLEIFRWKNPEEIKKLFKNADKKEEINDELADILFFLLRITQFYNIDLSESLNKKMMKNNAKYPVEKSKGKHNKYNEL